MKLLSLATASSLIASHGPSGGRRAPARGLGAPVLVPRTAHARESQGDMQERRGADPAMDHDPAHWLGDDLRRGLRSHRTRAALHGAANVRDRDGAVPLPILEGAVDPGDGGQPIQIDPSAQGTPRPFIGEPEAFARNIGRMNLDIETLKEHALVFAREHPFVLEKHLQGFCPDRMPARDKERVLQVLFDQVLPNAAGLVAGSGSFQKFATLVRIGCSLRRVEGTPASPLLRHGGLRSLIGFMASLDVSAERLKILSAFDQLVASPADAHAEYVDLTGALSVHGLPQSLLLFPAIRASSLTADERRIVMHDFGNKGFKNAFKFTRLTEFLKRMEAVPTRSGLRAQLLLATCPSLEEPGLPKKQTLAKLLSNINLMEVALPFIIHEDPAFSGDRLAAIRAASALRAAVRHVAARVLGHQPSSDRSIAIERYFDQAEDPSLLLVWATRQREFVDERLAVLHRPYNTQRKNLDAVKKISSWIVDGDRLSRYRSNGALTLLRDANEPAYKRWCEIEPQPNLAITSSNLKIDYERYQESSTAVELDFDEIAEPSDLDRLSRLMALSREVGWVARVTSSLDDLLACGTRVPGSCQHVAEDGRLNQGLIGCMESAKMVGVWRGGALFGRNLLFLGREVDGGKHVIVMARNSYGQPECDYGYREVMKLAAGRYADWVGLELVDCAVGDGGATAADGRLREIRIPLSGPTYFDEEGVCFDSVVVKAGSN